MYIILRLQMPTISTKASNVLIQLKLTLKTFVIYW